MYGSIFLKVFNLEATDPTFCLSEPVIFNVVCFSTAILIPSGISKSKVNKSELSKIVAEKLAKKAQEKKITKIFFDRGVYKYHGRIKIFAETLRKNGMEF